MTAAARRHRDPARRAELLAAAAHCFASRGFDDVSMDDIAASAGVTKGLLFYYFGSKRQCYLAVIGDFHRQLLDYAQSHTGDLSGHDLTAALLDRYLDFAANAEPAYRLIMSGGLGADPEVQAFIAAHRAQYRVLFTEMVLPGQTEPPALRIALEGFLSFMEGATLDWLNHRNISREALHRLIMAVTPAIPMAAVAADSTLNPQPITGGKAGESQKPMRRRSSERTTRSESRSH